MTTSPRKSAALMAGMLAVGLLSSLVPSGVAHAQARSGRTVSVGIGRPGDHWASTLKYTRIAAATHDETAGYEVSFEASDGCRITLFWPRDQIDFRGDSPGFRLQRTRVATGWLWYPNRLTARSLPEVHRGVLEIQDFYNGQANGAMAAAQGFATVATLGTLAPVPGAIPAPLPRATVPRATSAPRTARVPAPRASPTPTRTLPTSTASATPAPRATAQSRILPTSTAPATPATRATPIPTRTLPTSTAPAAARGARAGDTAVYRSVGGSGDVRYVGITKNLEARAAAHLRQKGIAIDKIPGLQGLSRADARAVEQVLIEFHRLGKHGGTLMNKINSIARTNPKYAGALKRGVDLLKAAGYPGF